MREVTIKFYELDELNPDARTRAISTLRDKLGGDWWDSADNDDIRDVMIATLAEKIGTPGVMDYGVADFPGIDGVSIEGWSLDRHQAFAVSGRLDRDNAPGLPWFDAIDHVVLTNQRSSDYTHVRAELADIDCTCPEDDDNPDHVEGCPVTVHVDNHTIEQAVRDALSAAWSAGEKEAEHKASEESAIAAAEGREFTEDGELA